MNVIEEKLWNYIDGTCPPDEEQAIRTLIETDELYKRKYQELIQLNAEFGAMELDEPSMAFTYNVMEAIRTETAQKPLKAGINKYIIRGIGLFFVLTIVSLLLVALGSAKWTGDNNTGMVHLNMALPSLQNYLTRPVIQGFFFFDMVLGLFLLDSHFRKKLKNNTAQQL
jgi:anti-sigma factor RsiW